MKEKVNLFRGNAVAVGILYIIGTVAGILSYVFSKPVLGDANYLVRASENQNLVIASLLVLTMGFSLAMMSVVLYPVIKKFNETLALGIVLFRGALEAVLYIAAVIVLLLYSAMGSEYVRMGALTDSFVLPLGTMVQKIDGQLNGLTAVVFSLGALMIYYVFYKHKLIPRWLTGWGIVGAVFYLAAGVMALFGIPKEILMMPLALQEMVMAVWLIVKGFNSNVINEIEK